MRKTSTRTKIKNAQYPIALVAWEEDEDGNGWTGKLRLWKDGNTKFDGEHRIGIRQGIPLGKIFVDVDSCSHGAWASNSFEGHGLTERDLEWSVLWAIEALKSHPDWPDMDYKPEYTGGHNETRRDS